MTSTIQPTDGSRQESRADAASDAAMALALVMVTGVWLSGAVWSFEEQTAFAASAGFRVPWLLPLILDGLALALASVAAAASLDGRPAIPARLGTAIALASSAASNARWAWERTAGDTAPVVLAAGVPVVSFLAFEVLLAELRRQVHRCRGLPAPVAIPAPRLIRLALAPRRAFGEWRDDVLRLTAPALTIEPTIDQPKPNPVPDHDPAPDPAAARSPEAEPPNPRRRPARRTTTSRAPSRRRSIEELRTDLAASIDAGTLPINPSAEAIRKALRVGLARARQLRDEAAGRQSGASSERHSQAAA
jgi:hypothetical protein